MSCTSSPPLWEETLEWNGEYIKGTDPLNIELMGLKERFPDMRFRWMHPNEPITSGPKYQKFIDPKTQKELVNGELTMCFMPERANPAREFDDFLGKITVYWRSSPI